MVRPQPEAPLDPTAHPEAWTEQCHAAETRIVAIGASVGGLQALSVILAALLDDFPAPVVAAPVCHPPEPPGTDPGPPHGPTRQGGPGGRQPPGEVGVRRPTWQAPAGLPRRNPLSGPDGKGASLSSLRGRSAHVPRRQRRRACGRRGLDGRRRRRGGGNSGRPSGGRVTIAQDMECSENPSMPCSAAATGDVDHVLPLDGIACALMTLLQMAETTGGAWKQHMNGPHKKAARQPALTPTAPPPEASMSSARPPAC